MYGIADSAGIRTYMIILFSQILLKLNLRSIHSAGNSSPTSHSDVARQVNYDTRAPPEGDLDQRLPQQVRISVGLHSASQFLRRRS